MYVGGEKLMGLVTTFRKIKKQNRWGLNLVTVAVVIPLILLFNYVTDPYMVAPDVQNHYWMAKFQDANLFPEDRLQYTETLINFQIGGRDYIIYPPSLGYALLFYVFSFLIPPILFGKLLVFFLMPISAFYMYKIGIRITKNNKKAFFMGMFFIFISSFFPESMNLASGLQKSLAFPLIIVFSYYLMCENYWVSGGLIVIAGLFYMPNALLMTLMYGLSLLRSKGRQLISIELAKQRITPLISAVLICGAIGFWVILSNRQMVTPNQTPQMVEKIPLKENPIYLEGGQMDLFTIFPWIGKVGLFELVSEPLIFYIFGVLTVLILLLIKKGDRIAVPGILWCLFVSGTILYLGSLVFIFGLNSFVLYMPSRYSRLVLYFIPLSFVGLNFYELVSNLPAWIQRNRKKTVIGLMMVPVVLGILFTLNLKTAVVWLILTLGGVFLVLLMGIWTVVLIKSLEATPKHFSQILLSVAFGVLAFVPVFMFYQLIGFHPVNPNDNQRALYEYLASLPKDTLVAGSPQNLDGVPLFSHRNVLFRRLFPDPSAPIIEMFNAYYGDSASEILEFCYHYGVDTWVIDKRDFEQEFLAAEDFFYQPYNESIKEIVSKRSKFILLQATLEFESGPLSVVACDETAFP